MSRRVQVILGDEEREAFRRMAVREGRSLSAWLRTAGLEKLAAASGDRRLTGGDELRRFFADCDQREHGSEPDWTGHDEVIRRSIRSGESET